MTLEFEPEPRCEVSSTNSGLSLFPPALARWFDIESTTELV